MLWQNSKRRFKISLSFKALKEDNGILMYCAQSTRGFGDFIALLIYKRRLRLLFDMGSGVTELNSNYTIETGKWYNVNVTKDFKVATLTTNTEGPIKKLLTDSLQSMSLKTLTYFGGVDRKRVIINKHVKVKHSFYGCFDNIKIHTFKSHMLKSLASSSNVEDCHNHHPNNVYIDSITDAPTTKSNPITKFDFCLAKPCIHGICQNVDYNDYSCTCEYGYVGRNCENILKQCELLAPCLNGGTCTNLHGTYKCDCRYGYAGQNCTKNAEISDDATFNGNGWLELDNSVMTHEDEREVIGFEISTNETYGLILWHADNSSKRFTNNYIALAVIDGYVEFQFNLGSGPGMLKITSLKVNDGRRHRIILKRHGRDGSIELDGEYTEVGSSDGHNQQLEITGNVFIAGVPDYSTTYGKYYTGFSGCIHTLEVQDSGAINLGKNTIRGKNLSPCTRARWIPSSLVFTDAGEDIFDAFVPPPPVNIIHPKPTANKASNSFYNAVVTASFLPFFMTFIIPIIILLVL